MMTPSHSRFWSVERLSTFASTAIFVSSLCACTQSVSADPFDIRLETVVQYNGDDWMWFHPRVAAVPGMGKDGAPLVVMTLQKHLVVSDFYSGMYSMTTDDLGTTWSGPEERPELAWRQGPDGEITAICDVTPGWHAKSGKVLAIGIKLRYNKEGGQLRDESRSLEAAYYTFDPKSNTWTPWRILEMPDPEGQFYTTMPGCVQWLVEEDGGILLPLYFSDAEASKSDRYSVTVVKCSFDGENLTYVSHGEELSLDVERGLCEPSLTKFRGKYFMTIRNDVKGYVTMSADGLHFEPIKPWTFDDGEELGSYNTQQHWLTHSDGLFLCYTRRGANNDHVFRHRAPLFIAQVDAEKLHVIRSTERILMPDHGATYGNFGATAITESESWVTDAEGMFGEAKQRGAAGRVFAARVRWARPNALLGGLQ